ncbi:MAG: cbb3-type cytochrome c oxidase N-terminal domain-containing protein [Tepidisphaeraceae bacterium]
MSQTENKDLVTEHAYDGIQEYDNPTPGWWNWIFIGSIAFAAIYWFVTLLTPDLSPEAEYAAAETKDAARSYGDYAKLSPDATTLVTLMQDKKALALGKSVFLTNCASCHGPKGQGLTSAPTSPTILICG